MKYKNIIFDLDGTLTDSGPGIRNCVKYALSCFGIKENDEHKLNRFIGPSLYDCFIKYYDMSEKEAEQSVVYFRERYCETGIYENSLYDGITECLSELKRGGLSLFVATSKPDFMALQVISHFGIEGFFDGIYGASIQKNISAKKDVLAQLFSGRSDISPAASIMVGDREQDVFGAAAFEMSCIGVLWGYGSQKEFTDAGARYTVSYPSELSAFLLK